MTILSCHQVIILSYDHVIRSPDSHVIIWSHDHMIILSYDYMFVTIIWSSVRITIFAYYHIITLPHYQKTILGERVFSMILARFADYHMIKWLYHKMQMFSNHHIVIAEDSSISKGGESDEMMIISIVPAHCMRWWFNRAWSLSSFSTALRNLSHSHNTHLLAVWQHVATLYISLANHCPC